MQECDLIMKGGITSGVVYPHALGEIARDYRLRCIGGTSAGAIAAVFAAAAEYRRQQGGGKAGFDEVGALADELGKTMGALFQPSPALAPLFALLLASVSETARRKGAGRALGGALLRLYRGALIGALVAVAAIVLVAMRADSFWLGAFGVLLLALLLAWGVIADFRRIVVEELPRHDFGICSGRTLAGAGGPGFTDWIADKIDLIANHVEADGKPGAPLTVGQLEQVGIKVATMTTDLSSRRPYQLPLRTAIHYFSRAEFERLFAPRIVEYLCGDREPLAVQDPKLPADLYQLPVGADFPVLLVARMSLSFPGLIQGVPLYRFDDGLRAGPDARGPLRRCLFSDGGISSNFPIHFFDALMPGRPTFGIALDDWQEARHGAERVDLPTRGHRSTSLPVREISGLGGLLSAILNTAKDWRDTMQSMLPGYAERIVTVRLDSKKEGGLNLAMDEPTIADLTGFGREAGATLRLRFSYRGDNGAPDRTVSGFDQHRYNRAISLLPEIEGALAGFATALAALPAGAPEGALTGRQVLTDFETDHYENPASWRKGPFLGFADALAAIGREAQARHDDPERRSVRQGPELPLVDSAIRLVALTDRVPRGAGRT